MLNQTLWRNAAWLVQAQHRSKLRTEVCYISQCCSLKKEHFIDDYLPLALTVKKQDADIGSDSEIAYFATGTQHSDLNRDKGKYPVKKTLSYTNKVLFGPLLETSVEKRRRIKAEESNENTKTRKPSKHMKQKSSLTVDPLIFKQENAHLLGLFPGSKPKSVDQVERCKLELQHQSFKLGDFSNTRIKVPMKKKVIFPHSKKNELIFDKVMLKENPNVQKLYVTSWNNETEVSASSSTDGDAADKTVSVSLNKEDTLSDSVCETESSLSECSQDESNVSSERFIDKINEHDHSASITQDCSVKHNDDQSLRCHSLNSNRKEGEEIKVFKSNREKQIPIHVDNTDFSAAPSVIDANIVANFPLEKPDLPLMDAQVDAHRHAGDSNKNSIVTIGMFDEGYQRLPSVSKILEATMPEDARRILERWKAKMIKQLGEEGFEEYRKGLFEKGKLLHGCIHSELMGVSPSVENLPTVQGLWTSISHVLPSITNVSVLESRLVHPYLYYQGAVDCVAMYKGMPVLIDWKTSTKPKLTLKSTFDNPLQLVAYLGALNYDSNYQLPHQIDSALVVVAYDSGLPAHVHVIDREMCRGYWKAWCARLLQFWRQLEVKDLS